MDSFNYGPGGRGQPGRRPPRWLMAVLCVCMCLVMIAFFTRSWRPIGPVGSAAEAVNSVEPSVSPHRQASVSAVIPEHVPTISEEPSAAPEVTIPPTAEESGAEQAKKEGQDADEEKSLAEEASWFSDAVFIGDSRVAGLRLYSGITSEAFFLDHTGLTIYEVKEGKKVIRRGDMKISVLDALSSGSYGKVYIALGVNELGYYNPEDFAQTCGEVVEEIREKQPEARIYIQSIIPVNTEKCKANDIPYYITNEGVTGYNEALEDYFKDKNVYLLGIPEELLDEVGEVSKEYSADGVHFKKEGYVLWLNYLAAHTEG